MTRWPGLLCATAFVLLAAAASRRHAHQGGADHGEGVAGKTYKIEGPFN